MFKNLSIKIYRAIGKINRKLFIAPYNRRLLKNEDFTIISSNCIAGIIYNDLKQQFLTPTVNLMFDPDDFMRFIENLEYYLNLDLVEISSDRPWPKGMLGDVQISFMHYKTFQEAAEKWYSRRKRVNNKNIFVIFALHSCEKSEYMSRFEKLPYTHKIILDKTDYYAKKPVYTLERLQDSIGSGVDWTIYTSLNGSKVLDQIDYVNFLNKKS